MKTKNTRWMMWMLMMAMAVGASAQKNVLKAFDKVKRGEGVIVESVDNKKSEKPAVLWYCNITELSIPKKEDVAKYMPELYKAFIKDSEKESTTFYKEIPSLGYNATEEETAGRKKIVVKYISHHSSVVIGEDPSYTAIVLRSMVKSHITKRVVVAMEYKKEASGGLSVKLYEIMGDNFDLGEETVSAFHEEAAVHVPQTRKDGIITRMHFYRDTYNGEDSSENSALLLNMTEYLNAHWGKASGAEQEMIQLILRDMAGRSKAQIHRDLIERCGHTLKGGSGKGYDFDAVKRVRLYVDDYKACSTTYNKGQVLDDLKSYIRKLKQKGINENTSNDVYEHLVKLRRIASTSYHQGVISDIVSILQK